MLIVAKSMKEISFSRLMEVYAEGCEENGREFWPEETPERQIALAEQGFYDYLTDVFFKTEGAVYAIWQSEGRHVSALRLEPYRDGLLLEALETAPSCRRRGFAGALMKAVLERYDGIRIYSHVGKKNIASLRTHESRGFKKILDYAVYIDGSVNERCCTLCKQ